MKKRLRLIAIPIALVWSGWFLFIALQRWRCERLWLLIGPPFEPMTDFCQSIDWESSLDFALWPLELAALWWLLSRLWRRINTVCEF